MIPTLVLGGLGRTGQAGGGGGGGGAVTWNPSDKYLLSLSNGNLTATHDGSPTTQELVRATIGKAAGKWYWEIHVDNVCTNDLQVGILTAGASLTVHIGATANGYAYDGIDGKLYHNGPGVAFGATYNNGNVIGVAFDATTGDLWFAKNNSWQASGNPAAGTNPAATGIAAGTWYPAIALYDPSTAMTARFTAADQTYSPPAGFSAIG